MYGAPHRVLGPHRDVVAMEPLGFIHMDGQCLGELQSFSEHLDKVITESLGLPPEMLMPGSSTAMEISAKDVLFSRQLFEAFQLLPPLPVPSPGYLRRKAKEMARKHRAELRRRKR